MMMSGVLLGRRLLTHGTINEKEKTESDALFLRIQQDDRFFCGTMEMIPSQYYFPQDEEENWRQSVPKRDGKSSTKRYHRDILAQKQQKSTKQAIKRAKFNPSEQKTNEELLIETAIADDKQKRKQVLTVNEAKEPSAVSMDGLKERLAAKLQAMRELRKADEQQNGKKRKPNVNASTTKDLSVSKKRKVTTSTKNESNATQEDKEITTATASSPPSTPAISYGSLLLDPEDKTKEKKKTRNGQGMKGIKNLLKKAERNQQRIEELKKTEEGKKLVEQKGWNKALKQAAGEVVLDDPKLLRKKLKQKEKLKAKSAKEWKKRTAAIEIQKKEKQKKRMENIRTGGIKEKKENTSSAKGRTGPRAGFEGKKGEGFLNAEKKKGSK